ncbi:ATP-binding cassette domain-containing protein [Marinobacter sp. G11]|jgi:putative phosphonate transport system ATP-binding protein|uniref:ABC transporter related n=1 Tax=Marinobacter nauticus (strain ATCC 700491 / DSM 11845 / VT8) TaxID=351348 RepID=A1TX58_MARN8|nr:MULTISPECIES: ATP-binding cassette domain-containing protein [Marinobacter]ABM17327.1 ABC transporter related protein [Marinobacter nauticus VT8]ABM21314.1 ABC transporter related [Marinobacter nauticus VT8]MAK49697.1 ABC transporter ATP-binding protein [Marinobacter sp.]MCE0760036.1 ATP-binding cassette domain-containing protein [Marinobacter sp. G11]
MKPILEVKGLTRIHGTECPSCLDMTGPEHDTNVCPACGSVVAAANVSFSLQPGEILGIMGESGSGKSTVVKTLYFDQAPTRGSAIFRDDDQNHELFNLNGAEQRWLRNHRFGMVYQNPNLGLNFGISAGGNIAERLLMNDLNHYGDIRRRAGELLTRTDVMVSRMDESPKQFSGGMQQRVQIAKALATRPPLLYLDEVTTGLDLSVQARILDLILEIQHELDTAMIVVTHDLGVIRLLASRTLVMKYGRVIESGLTDQILEDPQQAYTQQLVASTL